MQRNHIKKLFTDVTYIRTEQGWSYLSVVLDSFNNEILGWRFSKVNSCNFVYQSIKDALLEFDDYKETIIHSDHGFQYSSYEMENLRNKLGVKQSMGRVGASLDNRPVE